MKADKKLNCEIEPHFQLINVKMSDDDKSSGDEDSNPYSFNFISSTIHSKICSTDKDVGSGSIKENSEQPDVVIIGSAENCARKICTRSSRVRPVMINIDSDEEYPSVPMSVSRPTTVEPKPVITVGSDDECESLPSSSSEVESLHVSFHNKSVDDSGVLEIHIKVLWNPTFEYHRFTLVGGENLKSVFEYFANKANIPVENINLSLRTTVLSPYDVIDELDVNAKDVLVAEPKDLLETQTNGNNSTKISVQCRTKDKRTFNISIHPREPLQYLFEMCAKEIKCLSSDLKIHFDGEEISAIDTPEKLGIEDDDCFDIYCESNEKKKKRNAKSKSPARRTSKRTRKYVNYS